MDEQVRRFASNNTRTARENIERNVSAAQEAAKVAERSLSGSLGGMRELNGKLIDMAHANADAVFDLAHEIVGAQAPSDLAAIWSAYVKRKFEMMTRQTQELTELGQKFASRALQQVER